MDKQTNSPSLFRRLVTFLITAALVLGAVFLVANWQNLNIDSIRRWWAYRSLARGESGQVESFSYDGGVSSRFGRVGDDLLVCSAGGITLYSPSGTVYAQQACSMANPILSASGKAAVVYDAGGSSLYVIRDRAVAFVYTAKSGCPILSASLSAQGLLTVVTQTGGSKSSVTVYGSDFQPKFGVELSSRLVTDAILSPDGSTLALATAGQTNGIYDSRIAFYSLSRQAEQHEPDYVFSLGGDPVLKLSWPSGALRVLDESALTFVNPDGTQAGRYEFSWRCLKGFSLDGESACALLLGKARAGTDAQLITVDLTGQELGQMDVDRQVLSLSCAGRYLSVLFADSFAIYSDDLKPYHTTEDVRTARKALQREDGSALLISNESVRLYLPE